MTTARDQTLPADIATDQRNQLNALFGSYKAEWLGERLFDLFTEPAYFPELTHPQPCMLMGGRGTGKTTILKRLSYEGRYALDGQSADAIKNWDFFGCYYRVNTNRVAAFAGPEASQGDWVKLFAHYFNLEMCELALRFLSWYALHVPDEPMLSSDACQEVALSLNLDPVDSVRDLLARVRHGRLGFEALVNNIGDDRVHARLSMQGAPVDVLFSHICELAQFKGKHFFFLIDEYENFSDYQQEVVNTLIKHASSLYTFKVGVRELGLRRRTTLNRNEQLISPSDYVRIHIAESMGDNFESFAASVCNERLRRIVSPSSLPAPDIEKLLPALTEQDEAALLGVSEHYRRISEDLVDFPHHMEFLGGFEPLFAYFLRFWADSHEMTLVDAIQAAQEDTPKWRERYDNYRYALLFTLRRKKRGIHKYYAGWSVYCKLVAGNIRYLLELVDVALHAHLDNDGSLHGSVSPKLQTEAAQYVGRKNLTELEGLSIHGAKLTKLLLSLGRVFQVMAANPEGHTPEANQFALGDFGEDDANGGADEVLELLNGAVTHLALVRFSGNKLQDEGDVRSYDYMVHPIFCAFFEFSYRRKRKITLAASDLLNLVKQPSVAIPHVLRLQNRDEVEEPLPEQLRLFEGFYAGGA